MAPKLPWSNAVVGERLSGIRCVWGSEMDKEFMTEHAARCRSLAEKADDFTKRRLLDLAARYDSMAGRSSRPKTILQMPLDFPHAPPERR
jgi:hypothetical protein